MADAPDVVMSKAQFAVPVMQLSASAQVWKTPPVKSLKDSPRVPLSNTALGT